MPQRKRRLGDLLIEMGVLTEEELLRAIDIQANSERSQKLGEILIDEKVIDTQTLGKALSMQSGYEYVSLEGWMIEPWVLGLIDKDFAQKNHLIPLSQEDHRLIIAIANPNDVVTIDDLELQTGLEIETKISTDIEIQQALRENYGVSYAKFQEITEDVEDELQLEFAQKEVEDLDTISLEEALEEAPLVKLVNVILANAFKQDASDIHIEPLAERLRVRYR
ncbi:MAG: GspE/PulE family protein, partial [Candidatus Bipolaricaulia bacterium]